MSYGIFPEIVWMWQFPALVRQELFSTTNSMHHKEHYQFYRYCPVDSPPVKE